MPNLPQWMNYHLPRRRKSWQKSGPGPTATLVGISCQRLVGPFCNDTADNRHLESHQSQRVPILPILTMSAYLKVFTAGFAALVLVILTNLVVDPYGIYNLFRWEGVNSTRPIMQNHEKLVKAYLTTEKLEPTVVAMGTSRAEFGIDPEYAAWGDDGPRFNLALAGGSIYVTRRFLEHVLASGKLRKRCYSDWISLPSTASVRSLLITLTTYWLCWTMARPTTATSGISLSPPHSHAAPSITPWRP